MRISPLPLPLAGPAGILLLALLAGAAPQASSEPPRLDAVLDGVVARIKTGFAYKNWTSNSITTITDVDKAGNPEKVTVVTKMIRITDGERDEEILKAAQTEAGKSKDLTAKYARESKERLDRQRQRRAEGQQKAGRRSGAFDLDEIMPFGPDKRAAFAFVLREKSGQDGRTLWELEARSKTPDAKAWTGVFLIDPATFDILRAEVRPSKNPRFVKELWATAEIEVLDGRHLFIKRTRFKVDGGFLFIKRVRMIVEDVYTDVRILDGSALSDGDPEN